MQEEVGALDDSVPVHYYPEGQETAVASTSTPLDERNKGFQLLQRMGWKGKGLGRNEHGEQFGFDRGSTRGSSRPLQSQRAAFWSLHFMP